MGVDLKEVKTQYTLTGILCKVVVMGEDRDRHNSITWWGADLLSLFSLCCSPTP